MGSGRGQLRFCWVLQNTGVIAVGSLCSGSAVIQACLLELCRSELLRSPAVTPSDARLAGDRARRQRTFGSGEGCGGCEDPASAYYLLTRGRAG